MVVDKKATPELVKGHESSIKDHLPILENCGSYSVVQRG